MEDGVVSLEEIPLRGCDIVKTLATRVSLLTSSLTGRMLSSFLKGPECYPVHICGPCTSGSGLT